MPNETLKTSNEDKCVYFGCGMLSGVGISILLCMALIKLTCHG